MKEKQMEASVVYQKLRAHKALLYISTLLTLCIDIAALVTTLISGIFSIHSIWLIAFTAFDLVLMFVVAKTNFRFSYSKVFPIVYILINLAAYAAFTVLFTKGIFELSALILFVIVHVCAILCFLGCVVGSSKRSKRAKRFAVCTLVVFAAAWGVFSSSILKGGLFGQGVGHRALTFTYDEELDGYNVTGVVSGFGKKLTIPETFNDKKVLSVDVAVFNGVTEVQLDCAETTQFVNISSAQLSEDLKIFATKEKADVFKRAFIQDAMSSYDRDNLVTLANAVAPKALEEDEVFVSFKYDATQLNLTDNTLINTWYGKKGDTFDFKAHVASHDYDIEYADGYDLTDEEYLYKGYVNNEGWVLDELQYNGTAIQGTQIEESAFGVALHFEKVYEITVGDDNDTIAQDDLAFKTFKTTGKRYVTKANTIDLLEQLENRAGFTLAWTYTSSAVLEETEFTDLSTILTATQSGYTIYPRWTLNAPEITEIDLNQTAYVYGDTLILTPTVEHALQDVKYSYAWTCDEVAVNEVDVNTGTVTRSKILPQESEYVLTVEVSAPSLTSLTAISAAKSQAVKVNKKSLALDWVVPVDTACVYDAQEKDVKCSIREADVVVGDSGLITTDWTNTKVKDANTYDYTVALTENWADVYTLENSTKQVVIQPKPITIDWDNLTFTYNGTQHEGYLPTATVVEKCEGDTVEVTVEGVKYLAGTHTAKAVSLSNTNYQFDTGAELSQSFTIDKKPITLSWGNDVFTYSGMLHNGYAPTATVNEICTGDTVNVTVEGEKKAAGDYTATATALSNSNYRFDDSAQLNKSFKINQKYVTLSWTNDTFTYSGMLHNGYAPTATVNEICTGDTVNVTVEGAQHAADVDYTATATALSNNNYWFSDSAQRTKLFTINKKPVTLSWGSAVFTYSGTEHDGYVPVATANGVSAGDTINVTVEGAKKEAGNYTATATALSNTNYEFDAAALLETTFTINPAEITIAWSNTSLPYSGATQYPTATPSGKIGADDVDVEVTGAKDAATGILSTATLTGAAKNNYVIKSGNEMTTFTINPAEITIAWSNTTKTYNGAMQYPTATPSGKIGTDDVDVEVTGAKDAATGILSTATLTGEAKNNYVIKSGNETTTFTITPMSIMLNWTKVSGTYDGTEQAPEATIVDEASLPDSGLLLTIKEIATNATTFINVGTYDVVATLNSANYEITNATAQFGIEQASITLVWEDTIAYTYTATACYPIPTAVNGIVEGDEELVKIVYSYYGTGETTPVVPQDAGNYTVKAIDEKANGNYILVNETKAFTIEKVELTVVWAANYEEGEEIAPIVTGIAEGEETQVQIEYTYYQNSVAPENEVPVATAVGNYLVVATLKPEAECAANKNYTLVAPAQGEFAIVAIAE